MTWFVHHDEKILGPFSTEKILAALKAGEISYGAYIWSKGQVEWVPVSDWENNLEAMMAHTENAGLWKIRTPDQVHESLSFDKVVSVLKKLKSLQMIAVSPQEEDSWVPVYSSYVFMEALNISRRNFLRAPLMGLAKVTKDDARFSYVVKTSSLGQGGIGVYGLGPNFVPGTEVNLSIESEDLGSKISVQGTVVYNTDKGFVGVRFGNLTAESSAVIIAYMKRFQENDVDSKKSAA